MLDGNQPGETSTPWRPPLLKLNVHFDGAPTAPWGERGVGGEPV